MWKLTIEDDQASKTVVHLVRDDYTIGRAEENTVRLTERNISRRHARLTKPGERWLLLDLTSYNGCYVNGQRVSEKHEIVHGDLVQLGDYRLQVLDDSILDPVTFDKAVTMPAAPRSQALLGQPDRLVMVVGPTVGAEFPLTQDRPLVVGRGEECDVSINHPSVSRVHAEIQPLGDGRYEIVDRESANGVRVNGVELPRTLLDARDVIELGDVILKFIPAGDIYVPGADESQQASALTLGATALASQPSPAAGLGGLSHGVKLAAIGGVAAIVVALALVIATRGGTPEPEIAGGSPEAVDSAMRTPAGGQGAARQRRDRRCGAQGGGNPRSQQCPQDGRLSSNPRRVGRRTLRPGRSQPGRHAEARVFGPNRTSHQRRFGAPQARCERSHRARRGVGGRERSAERAQEASPASHADWRRRTPGGRARRRPLPRRPPGRRWCARTRSTTIPRRAARRCDRSKLLQAKATLQQKVRSGQASDRDLKMLRAVCKQLGDASCSN